MLSEFYCPSRSNVLQSRLSWVPMTILVLAFYATIFSGVYLIVAFCQPRWAIIGDAGGVSPSTANLLCQFFAKTIELAYVTICVAFLGQVLSRRALMKDSKGISLADMSMRAWIMQPGSMIVHWETLRFSALTFLGVIALITMFVGMLYTTAAEALGEFAMQVFPADTDLTQDPPNSPWARWSQPSFGARSTPAGTTSNFSRAIANPQSPWLWTRYIETQPVLKWNTSAKHTTTSTSGS